MRNLDENGLGKSLDNWIKDVIFMEKAPHLIKSEELLSFINA
jgi:hypothetical protein